MSCLQDLKRANSGANHTQIRGQDEPKASSNQTADLTASTLSEHTTPPRIIDLIRFFKLQAIAPFKSWRSPVEFRKIARHRSRGIAFGHVLLHLLPLCGAITLLILNMSQHFVGPTFHSSTALQFVAKLLELFMQASIAEIILCIVRTQILRGYMPLGALSATTQTSHISYLWSLDFFAAMTSHAFRGWRKCLFVILVPLLIILTALVGPSGATLMIPRPGSPGREVKLAVYSDQSPELSFPSYLGSKQNLTFDITDFEKLYKLMATNNTEYTSNKGYSGTMDSRSTQTILRMLRYKSNFSEPLMVTATIPTQFSATLLDRVVLNADNNDTASIKLPRPIVTVKCGYTSTPNASTPIKYFLEDGRSRAKISSIMDLIEKYVNQGGSTDTQVESLPPFWSPAPGSSSSIFNFIQDTCASNPILNPHWSSPRISSLYENQTWSAGSCFRVLTCSLIPQWESSKHEIVGTNDGFRLIRTGPLSTVRSDTTRPISIDWSSISSLNSTNFENMVFNSAINDLGDHGPCVVFAVSIVTIISEAIRKFEQGEPWRGSYAYVATKVAYGYGFGISTIAASLSLVIISIYCMVTVGYITYIISSGHTSVAWNSATELIVLALQSARPEHLINTSVGINSIRTYQEPVGIRVNDSNTIELVFANDSGNAVRKLRKVMPNRPY